jgi:hypothetical protein
MRLINSLIDDYTKMSGLTSTRMIAESIRDIIRKYRKDKEGKSTSAKKQKIQEQLQLTSTQINKIIADFEGFINQIDGTRPSNSRKSPRNVGTAEDNFRTLYSNNNIEDKNSLIKEMNKLEPEKYNDFQKYVDYYNKKLKPKDNVKSNDNIKRHFAGIGGPKSATGGKKSRRLRLKSNKKTKKRCKKSNK